ncbi:MAG: Tat pathway signal sequence domain protein, partial [Streptomyces sp.]|nr:Tat pathway signal sequence domain protein [Streptomyces sp.]
MSPIPRRSILKAAAVAGAAAQFSWALGAKDAQAAPRAAEADDSPVTLDWLEDGGLGAAPGSTVGVPWPKGVYQEGQKFAVQDADGKAVPVQSWPIAYWPDGSLKWTAHAVSSGNGKLSLSAGDAAVPDKKVTVDKSGGTITVSTGVITAKIGKSGATLIKSVTRGSTEIAKNGRLVLIRQPEIEDEDQGTVRTERFEG